MPDFTLRVQNFRAIETLEWSPRGVCLLAGPNGSGKTTLLKALQFLRDTYNHNLSQAATWMGASRLRRLAADKSAPVAFEIEVGDVVWALEVVTDNIGVDPYWGERLTRAGQVLVNAVPHERQWSMGPDDTRSREERSGLRVFRDKTEPDWLPPLINLLRSIRSYGPYSLEHVRLHPSFGTPEELLDNNGRNLWTVLHTWKVAATKYRRQFDWVVDHAQHAFPNLIEEIEFHPHPVFFPPNAGPDDWLPFPIAADGLLTGLLHLTAVAGAPRGAILAFDELENQLHPHAIRSILAAMREKAAERDLTIVLTTHSPVVMNEFKGHEDHFYVLERGPDGQFPTPLDKLHGEAWLSHFEIGDLYERNKIVPQGPAGEK